MVIFANSAIVGKTARGVFNAVWIVHKRTVPHGWEKGLPIKYNSWGGVGGVTLTVLFNSGTFYSSKIRR
jgi:hypothetical protein